MRVSEDQVPDFDTAATYYRARAAASSLLTTARAVTFAPASIDAGATLIGAMPHGVRVGDSWTGLSRMFAHPSIGPVVLEEVDLFGNGGGIVFTKEMINADINGAPAVMLSKQGTSKKSATSLTWFANGVLYTLRTPGVDDKSRDELLAMARNISSNTTSK